MGKDIFISYKSEEYNKAVWLKNVLETNKISCWMAPTCIPGGSNYAVEIPKAIKECKVFVLLLSNKAQESIWISKELNMALIEKKIIMPYMIEDCVLHNEFDFYLSDVQRYNAFINKSEAIRKMINEIRAVLDIDGGEIVISDDNGGDNGKVNVVAEEKTVEHKKVDLKNRFEKYCRKTDKKLTPKDSKKSGKFSKVWTVLVWIFFYPAAIVSVILGIISKKKLQQGDLRLGEKLARLALIFKKAGTILGIILFVIAFVNYGYPGYLFSPAVFLLFCLK